jgi:hypothetical protein
VKLPARDYMLVGGVSCPSATIDAPVWQAHVVKHPLGVHGQLHGAKPAPWNLEGWDQTVPPVMAAESRPKLAAAIGTIWRDSAGCGVPELTGGTAQGTDVQATCKACPRGVLAQCDRLCNEEYPVGRLYASATESLLADVEEGAGAVVTREAVTTAVMKRLGKPSAWDGLTVFTVGVAKSDRRTPIARILRADGLVAEFYLNGRTLRWRTTRRSAETGPFARASFLTDMAIPLPSLGALSDVCVVPRHWWESHGS